MKSGLNEPLLHFLLIGAGLFLLYGWGSGPVAAPRGQAVAPSTEIVVSQGDLRQMAETFERTWQRPPTEADVKNMVEAFVRDEIYYREAMAAGLDRDDSVIRRRLRLKMEYILEDITSWAEPADGELLAYMKNNPEPYLVDPRIAFRQVYVDTDKRKTSAESDARQILAALRNGADPEAVSDPIMLESEVPLTPLWDIDKQFGDEFSKNLLELKDGDWEGPIRSGFGLHLVLVTKRDGSRLPELNEVRETVKRDWMFERQTELRDAAYAKLKERYTVTVERPEAETTPGAAAASAEVVRR